jgi:hypothetical protein
MTVDPALIVKLLANVIV